MKKSIGTKLAKRLARGQKGINKLDAACREHDIAYELHKGANHRYQADLKLKKQARERIRAKDATFGERVAALTVSTVMKAKTGLSSFGAGLRKKLTKRKKQSKKPTKGITFKELVKGVRINMAKSNPKTLKCAVNAAIKTSKKLRAGKRITSIPRIIKVPSISGGALPLLAILAGLASAGAIGTSAVNIYKGVQDITKQERAFKTGQYKNSASGRPLKSRRRRMLGRGLYLCCGSKGKGLYLKPFPKN